VRRDRLGGRGFAAPLASTATCVHAWGVSVMAQTQLATSKSARHPHNAIFWRCEEMPTVSSPRPC